MPFAAYLALRFLVDGRAQSAFIVGGVAIGVAVQVFVSALIAGLQSDLIAQTVGSQPHVVVEPARETSDDVMDEARGTVLLRRRIGIAQRVRAIDAWTRVAAQVARAPGVRAVSAKVMGPGLAIHGDASSSIVVQGVRAADFDRIVPVERRLTEGRYSLEARDTLIGTGLARDLGVRVGDRMRLDTAGGRFELFTVRGIFDLGNQEANARWALVSLRAGQALFGLPGGATHLDVATHDVFEAESVAASIRATTALPAKSWMETHAQLLSALRAQSSSTGMIEAFVLLAVAMGITSVLVVSVVERRGQIGILRAVGASRATVLRVFLVQGSVMAFAGGVLGSVLGVGFARAFQFAMVHGEGVVHTVTFPPSLFVRTLGIAVATGLLAAALPARHAARLDPAVAIRHG